MSPRFSEHFGLKKTQAELDFVDIELERDFPLFVDPYAISITPGEWHARCADVIVSFFSELIGKIVSKNELGAQQMLEHLQEANDTRFGLSSGKPRGRGIGQGYSDRLYRQFTSSKAAVSGQLSDISDCELMIEGIGPDRISDMTINIIRYELIKYTQAQCSFWNIPMSMVPSGPCWNKESSDWINLYVNLPVYEYSRILLVPKSIVRFRGIINHMEYYEKFVLNYLEAEHLRANSSLVAVLKNGRRKVYKRDLKEQMPPKKDNIANFVGGHPETLNNYKLRVASQDRMLGPERIESLHDTPRPIEPMGMAADLTNIEPGAAGANRFHLLIESILSYVFYEDLMNPVKEERIHDGRKRVDIYYDNCCKDGFFKALWQLHGIKCPYLVVECKNYSEDVANPEFDQLSGRFSESRGKVGLLICRSIDDKASCLKRCRDTYLDNRGVIIVLEDKDIVALLEKRYKHTKEQVDAYMSRKLRDIIIG